MRTFKTFLIALLAAGALALPGMALAQSGANYSVVQVSPLNATYVASPVVVAADTEILGYVKYVGTGTATLAVDGATGDLTFQENGAAHDGFECPVSGALGGIIDVSDTACDTLGEVVDVINKDAEGKFKMVLGAALRSDSSNNTIKDFTASGLVESPQGKVLNWESATLDDSQVLLVDTSGGVQAWIPHGSKKVGKNPFADRETVLLYFHSKITNAGTIGNYEVHCTVENYVDGKSSTETDTTLYLEVGAATTAVGKIDEFLNAGGLHCQGGKLWVRVLASGADTSAFEIFGTGYHVPFRR